MLTSGVLTSLFYGLLSESSYELDIEGKHYLVTSTGMNPWHAFGLVVFTFLGFLVFISLLIPWILTVRKRFVYARIKRVTAKDLIEVIDETRSSIKELYPIFDAGNQTTQSHHMCRLYCRELSKTILRLHEKFLPQNDHMRETVKKYFRNRDHSSIITIDRKVSGYEIASDIALLKGMVAQLKQSEGDDLLLRKDCKEMEKALADLEQLVIMLSQQ